MRPLFTQLAAKYGFLWTWHGHVGKPLRQTDCGRTHGTWQIIFCDFQNIFRHFTSIFGLRTIFSVVKNLFVDPIILLRSVIVFLDLKNFPTRIFKKYWDIFGYFCGFKNYFWSVPFRLPYGSESVASEYLQAMTSWHEQSLLLTVREAFLSQYLTLHALLGKCDLLTERLVKDVKFVVKSTGKYMWWLCISSRKQDTQSGCLPCIKLSVRPFLIHSPYMKFLRGVSNAKIIYRYPEKFRTDFDIVLNESVS